MEQEKQTTGQVAAERVALILAATALEAMKTNLWCFGGLMFTLLVLCWISGNIKIGLSVPRGTNEEKGEKIR